MVKRKMKKRREETEGRGRGEGRRIFDEPPSCLLEETLVPASLSPITARGDFSSFGVPLPPLCLFQYALPTLWRAGHGGGEEEARALHFST